MREILFRGKDALTKEWIYGDLVHCENGLFMSDKVGRFVEVIPETVGQFTGLFDCTKWEELSKKQQKEFLSHFNKDGKPNTKEDWNGKKIFEGDICDMSILGNDHTLQKIVIKYGCVGYEPLFPDKVHPDDREWTSFWKSDEEYLFDTDYFTVIGNIIDNKELLDKGE